MKRFHMFVANALSECHFKREERQDMLEILNDLQDYLVVSEKGQIELAAFNRAIQKAKAAVDCDTCCDYRGAIDAYTECCKLIKRFRRLVGEDKRLMAKQIKYSHRISELYITIARKGRPRTPRLMQELKKD